MNKIDKSLNRLFTYNEKINSLLNKYLKCYLKFQRMYKISFSTIILIPRSIFNIATKISSALYIVARYSTWPMHWIWIWFWSYKKSKQNNGFMDYPFNKTGVHFWYGKPGSGKSTVVYHKNMEHAYITGKASYTNVLMEEPREELSGRQYYYNQVFNPSDIFKNGEQIARFDTSKFNKIVFEEVLERMNQRNNKKSDYNDEFIPMISAQATQRHQGIELFDYISQIPTLDIQLMLMLSGYHIPKIKFKFDYSGWLKSGKFRWIIKGWKIKSYEVIPTGGNNYELKHIKTYFYPCTLFDDMKYFKRLNMKDKYNSLPLISKGKV